MIRTYVDKEVVEHIWLTGRGMCVNASIGMSTVGHDPYLRGSFAKSRFYNIFSEIHNLFFFIFFLCFCLAKNPKKKCYQKVVTFGNKRLQNGNIFFLSLTFFFKTVTFFLHMFLRDKKSVLWKSRFFTRQIDFSNNTWFQKSWFFRKNQKKCQKTNIWNFKKWRFFEKNEKYNKKRCYQKVVTEW